MIVKLDELIQFGPQSLTDIYLQKINVGASTMEHLYDNYFADHTVEIYETDDLTNIHLKRNNQLFYYVENNANYIEKIKQLFPKFSKSLLPFYFSWGHNSLLCLNDSWCCLGWIDNYLNNKSLHNSEEIILLHFDSHSDMANPLLAKDKTTGDYYDLLRNTKINTHSLLDFFIAVSIGSIGIASYITILPLFFKKVTVIYINQFKGDAQQYAYELDYIEDDLFKFSHPNLLRMHNIYKNFSDMEHNYPHRLIKTTSINAITHFIPKNGNIFLHFDMDYFNNWLDGSAEVYRTGKNNHSLKQQKAEIDNLINPLSTLSKNILHTSIGLSPGFFPSRYYIETTQYLIKMLNNHGIHFSLEEVFPNFDII